MTVQILVGDCRERLRGMAAGAVQTCVTSPPYFGLRDYGHAGQIGLEPTPDDFVAAMVEVFREVRRVLRDDGTVWLNLGDSYSAGSNNTASHKEGSKQKTSGGTQFDYVRKPPPGMKPKDLIGIPWMVAFALRADGWYLRQDIIWHKPNPMPESVTDRCTKAHEYIFLLSKGPRYFFDAKAISEASCTEERVQTKRAHELAKQHGLTPEHIAALRSAGVTDAGKAQVTQDGFGKNTPEVIRLADEAKAALGGYTREFLIPDIRNKRSVWTVASQPFADAHFATYPPDLIEPCILAGCPVGETVLDPFGGAGTTGLVADRLGRNAVLCELNPAYAAMAERRLRADGGMFIDVSVDAVPMAAE